MATPAISEEIKRYNYACKFETIEKANTFYIDLLKQAIRLQKYLNKYYNGKVETDFYGQFSKYDFS